ncbi:MAG: cupin domain-containing protein [Eubacteriales bacterium]
MKKLICAKEVETLAKQGQKVICIDENTLITPSARDVAGNLGVEFKTGTCDVAANCSETKASCNSQCQDIDKDVIYNAVKVLLEKGMLGNLLTKFGEDVPYVSEGDSNLKLVRGNTAKWEVLDTGNPSDKVFYNELVNKDDGCEMNAGFITIEKCEFPWECVCQELYYVVEGTLTIESNGKVYTGNAGDCFFFQNGAKLKFGSPDKVKAFYATH